MALSELTRVKKYDCPEAAKLGHVHVHLAHLRDEFCEDTVEDGTNASLVRSALVDVKR